MRLNYCMLTFKPIKNYCKQAVEQKPPFATREAQVEPSGIWFINTSRRDQREIFFLRFMLSTALQSHCRVLCPVPVAISSMQIRTYTLSYWKCIQNLYIFFLLLFITT